MKGLERIQLTKGQAIDQGVSVELYNALKEAIGRDPFASELQIAHLLLSNGKMSIQSIVPIASDKKIDSFFIDSVEEPEDLKVAAYAVLRQPEVVSNRFLLEQCKGEIAQKASNCMTVQLNGESAIAFGIEDHDLSLLVDVETASSIALTEASRSLLCAGMLPTTLVASKGTSVSQTLTQNAISEVISGFSKVLDAFDLSIDATVGATQNLSLIKDVAVVGKNIAADGQLTLEFKHKGDLIFLFGESKDDVNASVYLETVHGVTATPAASIELGKEIALQEVLMTLIENRMITAAHNVSKGGVFTTLVEMSMPNGLGFDIEADGDVRLDAFLFGESHGRVVVTVNEDDEDRFIEFLATIDVPSTLLGHVTKGKLVVDGEHYGFIDEAKDQYNEALINRLK